MFKKKTWFFKILFINVSSNVSRILNIDLNKFKFLM